MLMQNLKCPACHTRAVPFWPVFWGFGPFKTVECGHCGAHLRQNRWYRVLLDIVTLIPLMIVGSALFGATLAKPVIGLPLLLAFLFGIHWCEAVLLPLRPVKQPPEGVGVAHTPEAGGPPDGA